MAKKFDARSGRKGATLVEVAFVLPICLLLLFGIYEYCRFIMVRQLLANAAREGARYAVVNTQTGVTAANIQDVVDTRLGGQGFQLTGYNKTTSIQVYTSDQSGNPIDTSGNVVAWTAAPFTNAGFGRAIAVRITGTYQPVISSIVAYNGSQLTIMPSTVPITATCIMNSEAN